MSKFTFVAVAAATFLGAVAAQAQVQTRGHHARFEDLSAYDATVPVARDNRSDMKVMGLDVPNGFREPAMVGERAY